MIDPKVERPLTLAAAARLPELSRNGRKPHVSQLYRWSSSGMRGVALETVQIAGSKCTTREAVGRFLQRLTSGDAPPAPSPRRVREKQIAAAERELASAGFEVGAAS